MAAGLAVAAMVMLSACGGSDNAFDDAPAATTERPASSTPAPVDTELRTVRVDFRDNFSGTSWYPAVERLEGIYGGWLYIETDLHPGNPDTRELARSICSGGLGVGIGTITDFRGVSVHGAGSEKLQECRPFEEMD
jgi:hypothetical protein